MAEYIKVSTITIVYFLVLIMAIENHKKGIKK